VESRTIEHGPNSHDRVPTWLLEEPALGVALLALYWISSWSTTNA
jgi:hypothetical protein